MTATATRPTSPSAPGTPAPASQRPVRSASGYRDARTAWAMVGPTTVIIVAVIIVPIIWNILLAFQDTSMRTIVDHGLWGKPTFANVTAVLSSPGFWRTLGTTVIYSVTGTAGSIAAGLAVALAFRKKFRGRGVLRALMLLPYVAPVVAVAFVWKTLLNPQYGVINAWGTSLFGWNEPIDFLGRAPYAFITVILFEIWRYFPFAFMFFTARLTALPGEVEEAAKVDGATLTQTFAHVVFPQLVPTVALLSLLRLIMTFNKFDDVYLLTGGTAGTEVSAVRVYDQLTSALDISGAAANALVLSVVLGIALTIYIRFFGRKEYDS